MYAAYTIIYLNRIKFGGFHAVMILYISVFISHAVRIVV